MVHNFASDVNGNRGLIYPVVCQLVLTERVFLTEKNAKLVMAVEFHEDVIQQAV